MVFALKALGAAMVAGVWVAESTAHVPDGVKVAFLGVGVLIGYAAVRAERGRRGGAG